MDLKETQEFVQVMQRLSRMYDTLVPLAATEAVNFTKERFRLQKDIHDVPFIKRKKIRGKQVDPGRGVLIGKGTAILKRDVQKNYIGKYTAIITTTKLTVPYAKVHNEGFKGTVTVPEHTRSRFKKVKEEYTTKKGNKRTRTSKQVDTSKDKITVRAFTKKMDLPKRQYMGPTPILYRRIETLMTAQFIKALKG